MSSETKRSENITIQFINEQGEVVQMDHTSAVAAMSGEILVAIMCQHESYEEVFNRWRQRGIKDRDCLELEKTITEYLKISTSHTTTYTAIVPTELSSDVPSIPTMKPPPAVKVGFVKRVLEAIKDRDKQFEVARAVTIPACARGRYKK